MGMSYSKRWKKPNTMQSSFHYMEQSILVYVSGFAKTPLEFELTRNDHMKETPDCAFTVSAVFKEPPRHLHTDAWRILMHVVRGKELLPVHAQEYCYRATGIRMRQGCRLCMCFGMPSCCLT